MTLEFILALTILGIGVVYGIGNAIVKLNKETKEFQDINLKV